MRIGEWVVEPTLLQIRRDDTTRRLEPIGMSLLLLLADRAPGVITRDEIFEIVWEGRAVVDETLSRAISVLRHALDDDARSPRYIETIPTKGYRLIAVVDRDGVGESRPSAQSDSRVRPASSTLRWSLPVALFVVLLAALWVALLLPRARRSTPTPAPAMLRPAIAVLPFSNLSGGDELFFSDGLTEELIHQLSGIAGLKVVSRTSSMKFRDSPASAGEIASQLGVQYLLEGTVLVVDDEVRITTELVRPDRDEQLFSRTYDRRLEDVLGIHRAVARDVAREIRVQVTEGERVRLGASTAIDPEAYRLYLRGVWAMRQRTGEEMTHALELLQAAVAREPDFALAWSALADAHLLSVGYLMRPTGHEDAQQALATALALDPDLAQAHASLGLLYTSRDQDWSRAEVAYLRAIELEPSYVTAQQWYSEMLALTGRYAEAVDRARIAVDLDPLSPLVHAALAQRLSAAKRYREAVSEFQTAEGLGATFVWHLRELSYTLFRLGDEAGAAAARRLEAARSGADDHQLAALDESIAAAGLGGFWKWQLAYLESQPNSPPFAMAEASAGLGLREAALAWIGKTIESDVLWVLRGQRTPAFDRLRDDPAYLQMLGSYALWRP
ncbi:MAG: winged helix-turn-helix domain-containing protein [Thermoanaerobaculia bacterium]|nr:winged helix-turn-helix domain-containing protein [Thermoanaerobaculia bacterium]